MNSKNSISTKSLWILASCFGRFYLHKEILSSSILHKNLFWCLFHKEAQSAKKAQTVVKYQIHSKILFAQRTFFLQKWNSFCTKKWKLMILFDSQWPKYTTVCAFRIIEVSFSHPPIIKISKCTVLIYRLSMQLHLEFLELFEN